MGQVYSTGTKARDTKQEYRKMSNPTENQEQTLSQIISTAVDIWITRFNKQQEELIARNKLAEKKRAKRPVILASQCFDAIDNDFANSFFPRISGLVPVRPYAVEWVKTHIKFDTPQIQKEFDTEQEIATNYVSADGAEFNLVPEFDIRKYANVHFYKCFAQNDAPAGYVAIENTFGGRLGAASGIRAKKSDAEHLLRQIWIERSNPGMSA